MLIVRAEPGFVFWENTIYFILHFIPFRSFMKEQNSFSVTGTAQNSKAGAVVISANQEVYYLEGIDHWDEEQIGREIQVSGELVTENFGQEYLRNEKGEWSQGIAGEKHTILRPVWR
ncbi:MAG: hypothetical protein R3D00_09190 [Bacteroidia bacterium]